MKNLAIVNQILAGLILFSNGMILIPAEAQQLPPADPIAAAKALEEGIDNGIYVDMIKVYDDTSLQLMLSAARSRLAQLQGFDQKALDTRIGAVTGASLQQQAISAQVMGPPIAGSTVSVLGPTGSTTTNSQITSGTSVSQAPSGTTETMTGSTSQTVNNVSGIPVQNVTTINPQQTAVAPSAPQSAALPAQAYNVSSLDALNEMMQLTYEIANLQMLLSGSLNDRYAHGSRLVKPKTTLGFPITITSLEKYKDAVAFVEVEAVNPEEGTFNTSEKPAVTAILPREKSYNVASITDNMTSIGGGVVSQIISGGFSFLRGKKTYYLVQDQDTLATTKKGSTEKSIVFSWQFRPVLGQRHVKSGMNQTFVQLAAPIEAKSRCFGGVKVTTYWRKYDRKRGVLKEVIPESIRTDRKYKPIPVFDQVPLIQAVYYDDLRNGQVHVSVVGQFAEGTGIKVGGNIHREGSQGFNLDSRGIRFLANAGDIAKYKGYVLSRDGSLTEIVNKQHDLGKPPTSCWLPDGERPVQVIPAVPTPVPAPLATPNASVSVSAYDYSNSVVTVSFDGPELRGPRLRDFMIEIDGRIYGLADAPIERLSEPERLRVVVPNIILQSSAFIKARPLFYPEDQTRELANPFFNTENAAERVVVFSADATGGSKRYLLYGNRLSGASILVPNGVLLENLPGLTDSDTLRVFELTKNQQKDLKRIYLKKGEGERPFAVAMPDSEGPKAEKKDRPLVTVTLAPDN